MINIIYFLLIISVILILYIHASNTTEGFTEKDDFSIIKVDDNNIKKIQEINRVDFNKLFSTDIVVLPHNIYAVGIFDNKVYLTDDREKYNIESEMSPFPYLQIFIVYTIKYIIPHLNVDKISYIYSVCDGHGENIPIFNSIKYYTADVYEYNSKQPIRNNINDEFPLLYSNKYILTNSKLKKDIYAKAVPDPYFISSSGHKELIKEMEIIRKKTSWDNKNKVAVWRGNIHNGSKHNFVNKIYDKNQRIYFESLYNNGIFSNVNFSKDSLSKEEMCKYKYLIDIDGFSNTWDATIWKLISGCVLLKVNGVWEQWYYDKLKEWIHYVPINDDFSDLNEKIEWCISHDSNCKEISDNAYNFVLNELTFKKAQDYTINVFNNYIVKRA